MIILGIDPGASGALAWVETGAGVRPRLLAVADAPTLQVKSGNSMKTRIDLPGLVALVGTVGAIHPPDLAVIETVGSRPGEGVGSVFAFGYATGLATGVVAGVCDVPVEQITPQVWRRFARVTGDKDDARQKAMEYFSDQANHFKRKKDHGRADAALIAFGYALKNIC